MPLFDFHMYFQAYISVLCMYDRVCVHKEKGRRHIYVLLGVTPNVPRNR